MLAQTLLEFFFERTIGKLSLVVAGVLALFTAYTFQQRSIGAEQMRAKIEKASHANVQKARAIRERAAAGPVDGLRDPYAGD